MADGLELAKNITEVVHNTIVSLAALAGGIWAVLRFKRERSDEAALVIDVSYSPHPYEDEYLVFVSVVLRNVGKTKIQAKNTTDEFAYVDGTERLHHSCSLQLRRIKPWVVGSKRRLDWFASPCLEPVDGLQEVNLLSDYEDPKENNAVDFWMEPGETYCLGTPLVLAAGSYLAKVTVVGSDNDGDYWTRVLEVLIPDARPGHPPKPDPCSLASEIK